MEARAAAMRGPGRVEENPAFYGAGIIGRMDGLHLTADLCGCDPASPLMTDPAALRVMCLRAAVDAALQPVGELFHRFPHPGGVTGVVLLAESHLAVHTWPELASVTVDVYVCNFGADNSARAETLLAALVNAFGPVAVQRHALRRGRPTVLEVAGP